MYSSTEGSCNLNFCVLSLLLLFVSNIPSCFAKNIQDILKPTKNTFDWLDRLDTLETLEHNATTQQFEKENLQHTSRSVESLNWVKTKTKEIRKYTRVQVTEQFTLKPGKVKSRPLKLSELSEYYDIEEIGEEHEHAKTQRGYGLKFNYEFK